MRKKGELGGGGAPIIIQPLQMIAWSSSAYRTEMEDKSQGESVMDFDKLGDDLSMDVEDQVLGLDKERGLVESQEEGKQ
jgi:hypothetical protein